MPLSFAGSLPCCFLCLRFCCCFAFLQLQVMVCGTSFGSFLFFCVRFACALCSVMASIHWHQSYPCTYHPMIPIICTVICIDIIITDGFVLFVFHLFKCFSPDLFPAEFGAYVSVISYGEITINICWFFPTLHHIHIIPYR
eukprot:76118_1